MWLRVKVVYGSDTRLIENEYKDLQSALKHVHALVEEMFNLSRMDGPKTYLLTYKDEENDRITIASSGDLSRAIQYAKSQKKVLKLFVHLRGKSSAAHSSSYTPSAKDQWYLPQPSLPEDVADGRRKKRSDLVRASVLSMATINRIRIIVDQLDMSKVNPKLEFVSIAIGDPTKYPHLQPFQGVTDSVKNTLMSQDWNGYGPSFGHEQARVAIANKYKPPHFDIDETDVYLTCGCSDAINMTISALVNPGENILLPQPGFSLYETICSRYGFVPKFYRCLPEKEWEVDLEHVESLIDHKTKAILLNNPSNPCGSVLSKDNLLGLLAIADKHHLPIVTDEIYDGMVFTGEKFFPLAHLTEKVPIITLGGLAKQYLVPGWRLGWIIIHDPIGALKEVKSALQKLTTVCLGPTTFIQAALPAIFAQTPPSYYRKLNETLQEQALAFHETFAAIPELKPVRPRGSMYMMVGIDIGNLRGIENDIDFANKLLEEEALLVLPGSIFGMANYFRAVVCPPLPVIQEIGKRMKRFCAKHRMKPNSKL